MLIGYRSRRAILLRALSYFCQQPYYRAIAALIRRKGLKNLKYERVFLSIHTICHVYSNSGLHWWCHSFRPFWKERQKVSKIRRWNGRASPGTDWFTCGPDHRIHGKINSLPANNRQSGVCSTFRCCQRVHNRFNIDGMYAYSFILS